MRAFLELKLQIRMCRTLNIRTAQPQLKAGILYNPKLTSLGGQMGEDVKDTTSGDVCV